MARWQLLYGNTSYFQLVSFSSRQENRSKLISAEVGGIISNNGAITVGSTADAETAVTQDGHSALEYYEGDIGEDARTIIIAGRNDFQLHSLDMMGEGNSDYTASLFLSHATLITDDIINEDECEYTSDVNRETLTAQDY